MRRVGIEDFPAPIPEDFPYRDGMVDYMQMKRGVMHPHDEQQLSLGTYTYRTMEYLVANSSDHVVGRATLGDPESRIELGLRYISGCGMRPMPSHERFEKALLCLDMVTNPQNPEYREGVDKLTMGKAYACRALLYLEKFREFPILRLDRFAKSNDSSDNFYQAAHNADVCVRCGYIPEIVLWVGDHVRGLAVDVPTAPRFRVFTALWEAWEKVRKPEIRSEEQRQQERKVDKAPNAYICAAPGCGVEAVKKVAFKACAGPCLPDIKPHYCSKACQVKDWPSHRPYCKPKSKAPKHEAQTSGSSRGAGKIAEVFQIEDEHSDFTSPGISVKVPLPGHRGEITLRSTTMTPEFMKEIRDHFAERTAEANRRWPLPL